LNDFKKNIGCSNVALKNLFARIVSLILLYRKD